MAEASSTLESNASSDDSIIKSIQETIFSELGLIPETTTEDKQLHEVNPSIHVAQIDDSHIKKLQDLGQNNETQITNFTNLLPRESIDERKPEQKVCFQRV
ncbi:hypothetical protein Hanom_Chr04g00351371 [Helianthus anomalus]